MDNERLLGRKIPPQLVFLAHDQRKTFSIRITSLPGNKTEHRSGAGCGIDQARKQFQCRRLPRAVRAEKRDHFAFLDLKTNFLYCAYGIVLAMKKPRDGRHPSGILSINAVMFCELRNFNNGHVQTAAGPKLYGKNTEWTHPVSNRLKCKPRSAVRSSLLRFQQGSVVDGDVQNLIIVFRLGKDRRFV